MVVLSTFEWETLKYRGKIPNKDLAVIALVSILTILSDLATAVIAGILLSTLIFAWEKGKALEITTHQTGEEKTYTIKGIVFFGSIHAMKEEFTINQDPKNIIIDLSEAKVMDLSALEAFNALSKKYAD